MHKVNAFRTHSRLDGLILPMYSKGDKITNIEEYNKFLVKKGKFWYYNNVYIKCRVFERRILGEKEWGE